MSKVEKRVEKWRTGKQPVPKDSLESILNHYFSGYWSQSGKGGSHIFKISHPVIAQMVDSNSDGDLTIPVSGGQKVKPFYLKKIVRAIDLLNQMEN
ncbi:hypothetical protein KKA87_12150 [bacterium]|nr:hypothetical protein [bacterium]MBU1875474.1 hypothetical protein [bacterium]